MRKCVDHIFDDKRICVTVLVVWLAVVCAGSYYIGLMDTKFVRFGPSPTTGLMGLKIDTWTSWSCVALFTFVNTVINDFSSDSIGPFLTNVIADHKTKYPLLQAHVPVHHADVDRLREPHESVWSLSLHDADRLCVDTHVRGPRGQFLLQHEVPEVQAPLSYHVPEDHHGEPVPTSLQFACERDRESIDNDNDDARGGGGPPPSTAQQQEEGVYFREQAVR